MRTDWKLLALANSGEDVHVESGEIVEITNTFYAWSRTASWGEDTVYTTSETPNVDDQTYAKTGDDISLDGGKVTAFDTNTITIYYDAEGPYYYPRKSEYDEQGTESKKVIELTLTDSNKVEIDLDPLSEDYVAKPTVEGTSGQILSTNGDGTTQWIDADNVLSDIVSRIANIEATLSRLTNGGA